MRHRRIIHAVVSAILVVCGGVWARPTTRHEAEMAVTGWLGTDPRPLGMALGRRVATVETYTHDHGGPAYYVVYLQPSGFVVVSADDGVEPIIGFADDGAYDPSFDNPMGALVCGDLGGRMAAAIFDSRFSIFRRKHRKASPVGVSPREGHLTALAGDLTIGNRQSARRPDSRRETRGLAITNGVKWRHLVEIGENSPGGFALMGVFSLGDIRVIPLIQSQWGQATVCGQYCYNYYTPLHYPAGCLATAMAQVMRYYMYPTTPIGVQQFLIEVGSAGSPSSGAQEAYTLGGDGLGGPYDWSAMPLRPRSACSSLNESQRQAIGALCYDAGIAVGMSYDQAGSGASLPDARDAMVGTFGYSNAVLGYDRGDEVHSGLMEMLNPNLDAKSPVILAILNGSDLNSGHAVVCDGYGYHSSTLYHHLNMGWESMDDAWYNLPDIDGSQARFTVVFGCIYNISTTGAGEIISGRVLTQDGRAIVNAKVFAESGGRVPHTVLTDAKGIYAIEGLASNSTYTIRPEADEYIFSGQPVTTGSSRNNSARSGNRSGIDFYAQSQLNPPDGNSVETLIYVSVDAPGDPGPHEPAGSDPEEDGTLEHPFDAIQEAIEAAVPGDTIVLLRGTYTGDGNRDLDLRGKAITLRSEDPNDPNLVTIDCGGTPDEPHRGFELHSYETPSSVLSGLTITGGYHQQGGAIHCTDGARPTITNCTFRANSARLGGAMFNNSSPQMVNCTFNANAADGGGAIYNSGQASDCNPVLTDCVFYGNSASHNGGAMYNLGRGASPTLTNCSFIDNFVSAGGGGAMRNNQAGSPTLTDCLLRGNAAATFGGAIRSSNGGTTTLTNCIFSANSALNGNAFASTPDDAGSQAPCRLEALDCTFQDGPDGIFNNDNSVINVAYSK